ncbi:hypothetical protein KIN20_022529 [Parelaphostrongylus tenuis]|uniref:Uncharacterized protein n=1 Tax=Parelaphostrongylus tenuis TaxID=148309 RepID=A0AAD5MQQ2_PARTN|nr:hypothetical protein KIN20_022529 [Parelaphostrongylus tenuis]
MCLSDIVPHTRHPSTHAEERFQQKSHRCAANEVAATSTCVRGTGCVSGRLKVCRAAVTCHPQRPPFVSEL